MATVQEYAALMDDVAGTNGDLLGTSTAFIERLGDERSTAAQAAARALDYGFLPHRRRGTSYVFNPFVPALGNSEEHFQWLKTSEGETDPQIWSELVAHACNPAVSARLHDLLWIVKHGDAPYRHAQSAIEDYLKAGANLDCCGHHRLSLLDRALALSKSINSNEHGPRIADLAIVDLDRQFELTDDAERTSVTTRTFRLLAALEETHRPADLEERVAAAHEAFADRDAFARESLFEVETELARGDPERVKRIRRRAAEMWMSEATKLEGMLRARALEEVEKWAQGAEHSAELVADARRARQEMKSAVFDWTVFEASVEVPTVEIERLMQRVVGDDDLEHALLRFGNWGPSTGDPEALRKATDTEMAVSRLTHFIPESWHHPAGFEIRTFVTPEEKWAREFGRRQEIHAGVHGTMAQEALGRIGLKYERTWVQLKQLLVSDLIWPPEADAFGRAFEHFWAGRHDEAILVALPRIESVLRRMASSTGQVVFRPPEGERPGGLKTLGEVMRLLRDELDEGWWHAFSYILADPLGLNLRNEYSHGLRAAGGDVDAALILNLVAYLRLLTARPVPRDLTGP